MSKVRRGVMLEPNTELEAIVQFQASPSRFLRNKAQLIRHLATTKFKGSLFHDFVLPKMRPEDQTLLVHELRQYKDFSYLD